MGFFILQYINSAKTVFLYIDPAKTGTLLDENGGSECQSDLTKALVCATLTGLT